MTREFSDQSGAVAGVVKRYEADEGWGVIDSPEVPGGCFVHFSQIEASGYRVLQAGQHVRFTFERRGQDGCAFRAISVWTEQ